MGRKEEGAGQGHLGGTGPGDSTEQDKTGAPAWPGSALSHCLAAHKQHLTWISWNPACRRGLGCEREPRGLTQDRNVISLTFKLSSAGWTEGTSSLLAAGSAKPRGRPKMAPGFQPSHLESTRQVKGGRKGKEPSEGVSYIPRKAPGRCCGAFASIQVFGGLITDHS